MASNTAFLSSISSAPAISSSYDRLGGSMDAVTYAPKVDPLDKPGFSPRLLMGSLASLRALGIDIDENNRVLKALYAGIMTNYSLYMLYGAYRGYVKAQEAKEAALAAVEGSAAAIGQQWHALAMGTAAAALVASSFAIGGKFGSGDWNLPSFNASNPVERRSAIRQLNQVKG